MSQDSKREIQVGGDYYETVQGNVTHHHPPQPSTPQISPQSNLAELSRIATTDQNSLNRQTAAQSLGETANPEAIPALCQVLEDNNSDVRSSAIQALGKIAQANNFRGYSATRKAKGKSLLQ